LLFNDTPKSFGARESSATLCNDAISRSFPSRKLRVDAFGVAESLRLRCGRPRRPMHDADSTDGGRPAPSFPLQNLNELISLISVRRAAASICSEIVDPSL
jgi:hypothetical protein